MSNAQPPLSTFFREHGLIERFLQTNPQEAMPILGPTTWSRTINALIRRESIDLLLINPHFYFEGFTTDLLDVIDPKPLRVFFASDANLYFEQAALLAAKCDLVLCQDFTLNLQFRNLGLNSEIFIEHAIGNFIHQHTLNINPTFDIGFLGNCAKENRLAYIEEIKNLLPHRSFQIHDTQSEGSLGIQEVVDFYCDVKVLLHFSRSYIPKFGLAHSSGTYAAPQAYAYKGRPLEAVLAGTACVAEYCVSMEFQYPEILTFRNAREAVTLIEELLNNPRKLEDYRKVCFSNIPPRFAYATQVARIRSILANMPIREGNLSNVLLREKLSRHYLAKSLGYRLAKARTLESFWGEFLHICSVQEMAPVRRLFILCSGALLAIKNLLKRLAIYTIAARYSKLYRALRKVAQNESQIEGYYKMLWRASKDFKKSDT